jgi:acetyl esterase/lipase
MLLRLSLGVFIWTIGLQTSFAQQTIALYENKIPGALQIGNEENYDTVRGVAFKVSTPTLRMYLPPKEKANGTAVVICPGGGYGALVMNKEGFAVAEYFVKQGVAAFVLKYRLPDDKTMKDKSVGPLQDAQQAIALVRQHAMQWNVDTSRVGIMGFSAGGHLASTAGTHFNHPVIRLKQQVSVRPDFMILVYPVISMTDSLGHSGSRHKLLGKNPSLQKIKFFSNELQVTAQTPPAFLIHAGDDKVVDVDNSISFYEALRHKAVPAEMHIYPKGNHGFVLKMPVEEWMHVCTKWMKQSGFVK